QAVYGLLPDGQQLLMNGVYGLFYIAMILAIASLLFNRRQF
ncbi:MAG: ABC transporter permease, partial [Acaryochloridaceae cyanobacterium RL_2_7]|nr:ABC transporter permease [Acaryochloridaceae cyanobacterium RL_2_7]